MARNFIIHPTVKDNGVTKPSSFASFTKFENFQAALSDHLEYGETFSVHVFPHRLTDWKFCPLENDGDAMIQRFATGKDFVGDCDLDLDEKRWAARVKRFEGKIGMKVKKYEEPVVIFRDSWTGGPKLSTFDGACKRLWKM